MNIPITPAPLYPRRLDAAAVRKLLPHRGGIAFIEHVELLARDHFRGSVTWRADSMGMDGHFPGCPVVPGVFLIEAAAQLAGAGLLASLRDADGDSEPRLGLLAGTRACTFRRPVLPDQCVLFELRARRIGERMVQVTGTAQVDATPAATFDLMVAHAPAHEVQSLLPSALMLTD